MNAWNPDHVRSLYEKQTLGFLTHFNGKTELHPTRIALAFRKLVLDGAEDPGNLFTLRKAQDPSRQVLNAKMPFETMNWGCFTMMLSELGKRKELADLLEDADARLQPQWENGGLFYPRSDELADEHWRLTHMDPHSGNGGIAYARLNVEDGQRMMWEHAWTRELLASRPWIDGVTFSDDIDFLRASWDGQKSAMIMTVRRWKDELKSQTIIIRNLGGGRWATYVSGTMRKVDDLASAGDIEVMVEVGPEEIDIIIEKQ